MTEAPTTTLGPPNSFLDELRATFHALPDKGLFLSLLAAWMALFHFLGNSTFGYIDTPSLLTWMFRLYRLPESEDAHGQLMPWVVLGLFWWKRRELLAVPKAVWTPGLVWVGLALLLHVAGYLVQQPRVSIIALLGGIYALMATVWGRRFAAASRFPFVLLIFCIPVGNLSDPITIPLRHVSTDIAVFIARQLLGVPVLQDGVVVMDPRGTYSYEVAAACSGIRSLVTLLALTTIYGFVTFRAGWKRLLMVLLALPLALTSNVIRLVAIIVAAEAFGAGAGEFVHNWFGFVTFALALAVVIGLGYWLREPATDSSLPAPAQ